MNTEHSERLTEQNPNWINDELWMSTREPDEKEADKVYHRLREYEDTELTPEHAMFNGLIMENYKPEYNRGRRDSVDCVIKFLKGVVV